MHVEKSPAANPVKLIGLSLLLLVVSSCADIHKSADFERHRYSQMSEPYDRNDVVYFDATFTAEFPDNESGEATRMEWLQSWLDQRNMCADGFEIVVRRPFESLESNPAHHDIRYEVICGAE